MSWRTHQHPTNSSGGLRKLRWGAPGQARRDAVDSKADRDDLTRDQSRVLRRVVEEELR